MDCGWPLKLYKVLSKRVHNTQAHLVMIHTTYYSSCTFTCVIYHVFYLQRCCFAFGHWPKRMCSMRSSILIVETVSQYLWNRIRCYMNWKISIWIHHLPESVEVVKWDNDSISLHPFFISSECDMEIWRTLKPTRLWGHFKCYSRHCQRTPQKTPISLSLPYLIGFGFSLWSSNNKSQLNFGFPIFLQKN